MSGSFSEQTAHEGEPRMTDASLGSLGIKDICINVSNAFVGTIADIGKPGNEEDVEHDRTLRTLMKENRYMYLALLVLFLMVVGNVVFTSE